MNEDDAAVATSQGLIRCLRMLTEEAAELNLMETFAALQDAMFTCHQEIAAGLHEPQSEVEQVPVLLH